MKREESSVRISLCPRCPECGNGMVPFSAEEERDTTWKCVNRKCGFMLDALGYYFRPEE